MQQSSSAQPAFGLFGRGDEHHLLDSCLRSNAWVTLIGPAGVGKTCMARAMLTGVASGWSVRLFCDLTAVQSLNGLLSALVHALGLPLPARDEDPVDLLGDLLAGQPPNTLLVLDNCEQLIADPALGFTATLRKWHQRASGVTWLLTSRQKTGAPEEVLHPLHPFPVESNLDLLLDSPAAQLFVSVAQRSRSGYRPSQEALPLLQAILRTLDGLPLAIELAAARMSLMREEVLLAKLREAPEILATARTPEGAAHPTLERTIAWSWDLLSLAEQHVLVQCSAFSAPFSFAEAEAVVEAPQEGYLADILQSLLEKQLLQRADSPRPDTCLHMLYAVRVFVRTRHHDEAATLRRLLRSFSARAQEMMEALWRGQRQEVEREGLWLLPHLRRALAAVCDVSGALDAVPVMLLLNELLFPREHPRLLLGMLTGLREHLSGPRVAQRVALVSLLTVQLRMECILAMDTIETRQHIHAVLDALPDTMEVARVRARAWYEEGVVFYHLGLHRDCVGACNEALKVALKYRLLYVQVMARTRLAAALHALGQRAEAEEAKGLRDEAEEAYTEAHRSVLALRDPFWEAFNLTNWSALALNMNQPMQAESRMAQVLQILDTRLENPRLRATVWTGMGALAMRRGALREAAEAFGEGRRAHRLLGQRTEEAYLDIKLGETHLALYQWEEALQSYQRALGLTEALLGVSRNMILGLFGEGQALRMRGHFARAVVCFSKSVEHARAQNHLVLENLALGALAASQALAGDDALTQSLAALEALAPTREGFVLMDTLVLRFNLAVVHLIQGDPAPAMEVLSQFVRRESGRGKALMDWSTRLWPVSRLLLTLLSPEQRAEVWRQSIPEDSLGVWFQGESFTMPGSTRWVDLGRHLLLQRLLWRLVSQPGEPASADEMLEAGWPGESMQYEAGLNRLYKNLSVLRRKGLGKSLLSKEGGYMLDPKLTILVVPALAPIPELFASR